MDIDAPSVLLQGPMPSKNTEAAITQEERLMKVMQRFLFDLCAGLNRDTDPNLTPEEVKHMARMYFDPSSVIHPDGLLGVIHQLQGPDQFFDFITLERAAYRTVSVEPLIMAVSPALDTVFALSVFKMKSVGPWFGKEATRRVSEGIRIDELRTDREAKVLEAWCNRQLFDEEREVLLRNPEEHHQPAWRPELLRAVPTQEEGPLSATSRLNTAARWAEAWNLSAQAGTEVRGMPDPNMLDEIAEPDFVLYDALNFTGNQAQEHPYTAIRSLQDAKTVLQTLAEKYDIAEAIHTMAVVPGYNAAFAHWKATLTPRTDAQQGDAPTASYCVEATDLQLFSDNGKLQAMYQFRRPLGSDRRRVLMEVTPGGASGAAVVQGA